MTMMTMLRSTIVICAAATLSVLPTAIVVVADTVLLAQCPQEPDVVGEYYNNGQKCVRDRIVFDREIIPAECPPHFHYKGGYCRRRHYKKVKPTCPDNTNDDDFQRYGSQCHRKCPNNKAYKQNYDKCILPRHTLSPKYMHCSNTTTQHRYGAYCCTKGVDCPHIECHVGKHVPGTFFYTDEGVCERQVQSIMRNFQKKPRHESCPSHLQQVWGRCQEPCPEGFRPLKGKCELRPCTYHPRKINDNDDDDHNDHHSSSHNPYVECPEATYKVIQALT